MGQQVDRIIEGTFTAVLVYLVVRNAGGFSQVVGAISRGYSSAVRTLQGR